MSSHDGWAMLGQGGPSRYRNAPPIAPLVERIQRDFLPRWHQEWGGKFILHGRPPEARAVHLDGNDYLGLSGHPDIVQAQIQSLRESAEGVVQSAVFHLDEHPSRRLARDIAQWMGKEDGFVCQSGFAANVGLLQTIADAQLPVYIDALAHASLWEGAHVARAPIQAFRHNDLGHLQRVIARHGPGVVVVDSVYSTTGAICPLPELVDLVEQMGCMLVVDESHSLGTHGPGGAGLCAQWGLSDRVHFITASLAKAFAGRAGFFTMPSALRHFMLTNNNANIFSSGLLAHEIAGLAATLKVVQASDAARARLMAHTRRLRASFLSMGYPITHGSEQIIALEAGREADTMVLRDAFEAHGVYGAIFCAPATSKNRSMLRLTLSASLSDEDVERVEAAARAVAALVEPWHWPIARRSQARAPDLSHKPEHAQVLS